MTQKLFFRVKCGIFLFLCLQLNAQNSELQIVSIAETQLMKTLSLIPQGQEAAFGFASRTEFSNCTIGKPIQIITLANNFNQIDSQSKIIPQNEWRIPVISEKHFRTLLTVSNNGNQYEVVDIGGTGLAKEMELQSKDVDSRSKICILRIYQLHSDFLVTIPSGGSFNTASYIPLFSGEDESKFSKSSYNYNEVIELISKLINN